MDLPFTTHHSPAQSLQQPGPHGGVLGLQLSGKLVV
jgi:hypothetical protein